MVLLTLAGTLWQRAWRMPSRAVKLRKPSSRLLRTSVHNIRNVGIVAHIDAGKTTTTEQILYLCGKTDAVGRVDDGNSVMDFLPEERERGITISSAAISVKWNECDINIIDTPGHVDFTFEVERSVRAMDASVIIVDALAGVQAQTRTVWKQVKKQSLSCVAFVNKMDRDGADFEAAIHSLCSKLGINVVPLQHPIIRNDEFCGVIDLINFQATLWNESSSTTFPVVPNDEYYDEAMKKRAKLVESIADFDEDFFSLVLESDVDAVDANSLRAAIRKSCIIGDIVPAYCGASLRGKGVEPLLDAITSFLPSPSERSTTTTLKHKYNETKKVFASEDQELVAFAFKVIVDQNRGPMVFIRNFSGEITSKSGMLWNSSAQKKERHLQLLRVSADELLATDSIGFGDIGCVVGLKNTVTGNTLVLQKGGLKDYELEDLQVPAVAFSLAIEPEKSSQYEKLVKSLSILVLEDPSLHYEVNEESGQLLLHGIGELHLDIVCERLSRQFNTPVEKGNMFVAYREAIGEGQDILDSSFSFEKVMGGKRFRADICASMLKDNNNSAPVVEVENTLRKSLSSDEKFALVDGLQKAFLMGPSGYPVVGVKVIVSSLEFDKASNLGSIRACAAAFVESKLRTINTIVLEPHMIFHIDLPEAYVGDVLSDLNVKRRATIQDVKSSDEVTTIVGQVPLSTMLGYASSIRSLSQGQAQYTMEYQCHQPLVSDIG